MAEPTSIIGVLSASAHLAEKIYVYFSAFKDAPRHAAELVAEVVVVGHVLGTLHTHLQQDGANGSNSFARTSVLFFAVNGCKKRLEEIHSVLKPLVSEKTILKFWSRLKWPLEKNDTIDAVAALHRYAQIFHFAASLDGLSALSLSQHDALAQIQSRLDSIDECQRSPSSIELQVVRDAVEHLPVMSVELSRLVKSVNELVIDRQLSQLLNAVPCMAYQERHRDLQITRMEGAGQWILDVPKFIAWLNGLSSEGTLWCNGAPGVGKTYLASVIIDYLEDLATKTNSPVLYFYFDYKLQSQQTPFKVLTTLVHQLLSTYSQVPREALELHQRILKGKDLPGWNDLKNIFINLCNGSRDIFIVFDALDECDAMTNRGPVTELIRDIKKSRARLLVTSRPYPPDIDKLLGNCGQVLVEASDSDIRAYVLDQIARSTHMSKIINKALREEIAVSIISKSQGMFLLPALQINNILGQTNERQIREALISIPSGLADNLAQTIERIKSQHAQSHTRSRLALNVLMWLSTVSRPLTVSELQHAIATRPDSMELDDLTDPTFFVDCCFGLVAIDKETSIIRLVHFSVSEFLEERRNELFDQPDGMLAVSCLSYLLVHDNARHKPARTGSSAPVDYPFLDYAIRYWAVHAGRYCDAAVKGKVQELYSSSTAIEFWIAELKSKIDNHMRGGDIDWYRQAKHVAKKLTALHIASNYGITKLAEDELSRNPSGINSKDAAGATPLMLAAACGQADLVNLLLSRSDIDVNAQDAEERTALCYAIKEGNIHIVTTLLNTPHADINLGGSFNIACHWFSQGPAIAPLLLKHSDLRLDRQTIAAGTWPPWYNLALRCRFKLLQTLVARPDFHPWRTGRPSERYDDFFTFLKHTDYDMRWGDEKNLVPVITKLFEDGDGFDFPEFLALELLWPFVYYAFSNDIESYKDNSRYTIDWMRIWDEVGDWKRSLRDTLELHDISFETTDSKGRGFLHYLAKAEEGEKKEEFLEFLLRRGVQVDKKDDLGRTALHYAAKSGNSENIDNLLVAGANPLAADKDGWTVLHAAATGKSETIVQRFINLGANVNSATKYGESILHAAAGWRGSKNVEAIVICLLKNRAVIDAGNIYGDTALRGAIWKSDALFKRLLEHGADPSRRSMVGPIVLETVLENKIEKTKMCLARVKYDPSQLDCFGMSMLDLLADHNPSISEQLGLAIDWSTYVPTPTAIRRGQILNCLRERLKLMTSGDKQSQSHLRHRAGYQLLLLGDEASARIMYEQEIAPQSKYGLLYFPDSSCSRCENDEVVLFKCKSCPLVLLCKECRYKENITVGDAPHCKNHQFLQIPGDEWMSLPEGKVNHEGQSFDEWLKDLYEKYLAVE